MRFYFHIFCCIVLLVACGSDEITEPPETKPNYFPDTIGSRWVYQNTDGFKWTREITDGYSTQGENYGTFTYTPPISETEIDFLEPTSFRSTQNHIFFDVGEKIEHYIQTDFLTSVKDEFANLEVNVTLESISSPELLFLQIPLIANSQWDALNIKVNGNIMLQNLTLLQFPFDVHFNIKGEVIGEDSIETPAGRFENTFQVKFKTEIAQAVLSNEESIIRDQTIWFVPHVGIVKIEDEHGVMELIEYKLK